MLNEARLDKVSDAQDTSECTPPVSPEESGGPDQTALDLAQMSDALRQGFEMVRAQDLLAQEKRRKAKLKMKKDRRIAEYRQNQDRIGRGKYSFIISRSTFEQIVECIRSSGAYKKIEIVRILRVMYHESKCFYETLPAVDRKTVQRQFRAAFRKLDLYVGDWKQPSLGVITSSGRLLKEAEEAEVDLAEDFLVV